MSDPIVTQTRFEDGLWQGHVQSETRPELQVLYRGDALEGVDLSPVDEGWTLSIPVPVAALSEGVHSFVITDLTNTQKLGSFSVISGEPAAEDLRTEIDLLRGELDMLKRAFRRTYRNNA